jgi:hypothetical protein
VKTTIISLSAIFACLSLFAQQPLRSAAPALLDLKFIKDYTPGTRDANGQFMGGTETVRLIGHGGRLYAGIGFWNDAPGGDRLHQPDLQHGPL